ncbi:MAG: type II secretion system GspH family protein [Azoarcus sp.]|jgi:MSHA pilin protein MshD|nr:type II secretion system GspH family protein [Azoarcus sp.]
MCNEDRQDRRRAGFTLPELIMAIVIISVGLAGVLAAFRTVVKSSADPLIHKQMLTIAEEMMEEISLKPWVSPTLSSGGGGGATCPARAEFDRLDDYDGYECTGIRPIDDTTPISFLSDYRVKVTVAKPASAWNGIPAEDVRRVEVEVKNGDRSMQLVGWRANWAKG